MVQNFAREQNERAKNNSERKNKECRERRRKNYDKKNKNISAIKFATKKFKRNRKF